MQLAELGQTLQDMRYNPQKGHAKEMPQCKHRMTACWHEWSQKTALESASKAGETQTSEEAASRAGRQLERHVIERILQLRLCVKVH